MTALARAVRSFLAAALALVVVWAVLVAVLL